MIVPRCQGATSREGSQACLCYPEARMLQGASQGANGTKKTLHRNEGAFISRLRCKVMMIILIKKINRNRTTEIQLKYNLYNFCTTFVQLKFLLFLLNNFIPIRLTFAIQPIPVKQAPQFTVLILLN